LRAGRLDDVACGSSTYYQIAYSFDGIFWTGTGSGTFSSSASNYEATDIIWNQFQSKWFIVGYGSTNNIAYSYDGIYWTGLGKPSNTNTAGYRSIDCNSSVIVICSKYVNLTSTSASHISYSTDGGTTWNYAKYSGGSTYVQFAGSYANTLIWNGTLWAVSGCGSPYFVYSYNGSTWYKTTTTPSFITNSLYSGQTMATNGTLILTTAGYGNSTTNTTAGGSTLAYSYNGINWYAQTGVCTINCISNVWTGTKWIMCGTNTSGAANSTYFLVYSYDGFNWSTMGTSATSLGYISNLTNPKMKMNTITFSAGSTVGTVNIQNPTILCASGDNTIWYSYNGLKYYPLVSYIFGSVYGGAWNGNIYVACGGGGNTLAYSYDGLSWTGLGSSIFTDRANTAFWNGTFFLAGGSGGGGNSFAYSYNGINWTGLGTIVLYGVNGIVWNGTIYVAVGGGGSHTIAYSYDGFNWTGLGKTIFNSSGIGIIWAKSINKFVAVGGDRFSNLVAYSSNGTTWTGLGTSVLNNDATGISYNGTTIVVTGGTTANVSYSTDAINWTQNSGPFTNHAYSMCWNGKYFIGHAMSTAWYYSRDGINWNSMTQIGYINAQSGTQHITNSSATYTVVESQMTLNNYNLLNNSLKNPQTLEICTDTYFDKSINNCCITITGETYT
jgi:hypothetical protein